MTERPIDILLLEDEPEDREAILRFIRDQRLPYAVTTAATLDEARALMSAGRYEVVISDYLLPEGTGLDLLREAGSIPVIFITGHGDETIAALALRKGAYDYLIKDHERRYLATLPGAINNTLMRRRAERAVAESERRNRDLLENLPNGVYQTTPDGQILYANPALVRMLGYESFDELSHVRLDGRYYHPSYPRQSFIDRMASDGRVTGLESAWRTKQGQPVYVRESATAIRAQDGSILYFEGLVEDMTDRRLSEHKEKQYLRELSVLYETTSLLNSLDTADGMYQYLGEIIRELTGNARLILCRHSPGDGTIRINATWGFEGMEDRIETLLGFDPRRATVPLQLLTTDGNQGFTSGRLVRVDGGLHELSGGRLPLQACRDVEQLLGGPALYTMGFALEGHLLGGVIIMAADRMALDNRTLIETVINQGAMAIQRKTAEEQLRQSEEFSRTVIEHSPVGITVRDRNGRLLSYNQAWMRICNLEDGDIPRVQQVPMESIIQSYAELGADAGRINDVFQHGGSLALPELRVVDDDDGSICWLSQQIYGVVGPDGIVDRVVTLTEDVSERKRAEGDLRNQEEYHRTLIKNSSDIITVLNPDHTIRSASPSVQSALGLRPDDLVGRDLRTLIHPDDAALIRRAFRENAGVSGVLAPVVCRIRHADGSWRILEHVAQNLVADPVIGGVIVNSRDVTERRQADALRSALYELSELTNAARGMDEFYAGVHQIVARLIYARNFFICLYDQASQQLAYPYFVDEFDLPPQSRRMGRGLTDYIIRHNQPLLAFREHLRKLMDESAVDIHGCLPTALLAVPLKTSRATIGALVVQSYDDRVFFAERDKEILTYVSQQVAVALERKHTQDALCRSESDLRAVFNNISQVFVLLDAHQKIKSFNNKAAEWSRAYCGRELKDGDIIYYYLDPDLADDFTRYITAAKQGRSFTAELPFSSRGARHWFEAGFNPVYDDSGQVYGVCLTLMNIDDRRRAVEDLARSEQRFRAMVQHSSDNIIVVSGTGVITYQSPSVERMMGYRPDALLGGSAFDLIHPDDRSRVMDALLGRAGEPGAIKQIEYRARRADGTWVHLESVGNNLLHDPAVCGIVINTRDISERKQAEEVQRALYAIEELTNSSRSLQEFYREIYGIIRQLMLTPNMYVALSDPRTGTVSFPFWQDEYDPPPAPRPPSGGVTDHVIKTGQPFLDSRDEATRLSNLPGIVPFGTQSIEWLGVPLKQGERTIGVLAVQSYSGSLRFGETGKELLNFVSRHISTALERRNNREALTRLSQAVEQMGESAVITDWDGVIQYVNPAFSRTTGWAPADVMGGKPSLWSSGRHDTAFYRGLWDSLRAGRTWQGGFTNRKKDGTLFEEEVTISTVRNADGEIINYVAIMRDVTEKRRLQAIAEAANTMSNIGYVFSGIRHEIGNALNSMKMATSIVQKNLDGWPAESLRKFVDMAMGEVGRMEGLLRSLKNFSMYEAPKLERVDVPDFVKKLVSLAAVDFKSRGIAIAWSAVPGARYALADPRALHQAVLNLLTNAADALEGREQKRIDISVADAAGLVTIAISDNGCGLSPEQQGNLFKPFHTSKQSGTGLGLVITRNILARMNSTIEIASELGRGTTATVTVPRAAGDEPADGAGPGERACIRPPGGI